MEELIKKWIEYTKEVFPDKDDPPKDVGTGMKELKIDRRHFNDFMDWLVKNKRLSP